MTECVLQYVGFPNFVHAGTPALGPSFALEYSRIGKTACPACQADVGVFERSRKSVISSAKVAAFEAVLEAARSPDLDYDWDPIDGSYEEQEAKRIAFKRLAEAIRLCDSLEGSPS